MCIFGHKYGKVESDGFQYCATCGNANKPHPCANGHIWVDTENQAYTNSYELRSWKTIKYWQTCKVCGEKRSIEV
jgi:hypothetical protein